MHTALMLFRGGMDLLPLLGVGDSYFAFKHCNMKTLVKVERQVHLRAPVNPSDNQIERVVV